jgi:tetratricopeptide (TPR) repeat protein
MCQAISLRWEIHNFRKACFVRRPLLNCYLEIVLPERVCEHHFVRLNGEIVHCRGQRVKNGTAIPAIGVEQLGVYKLFYARENPDIGVEILQTALRSPRSKTAIGYDRGLLLRDEKQYEKAIEVFSLVLSEELESEISYVIHKERAQLYEAIGNQDKAGKDRRSWMVGFEKKYGHLPGADDSV